MQKKHFEEKQNLRLQQAELMAMFAELDPDPVFRCNTDGIIQMANKAGIELLRGKAAATSKKINALIPEINHIDLNKSIQLGEKHVFISFIGDKIYNFTLCGIPKYQMGQIYGSDVTKLKLAEDKIKEALVISENSEKLKTFFLLQMSHEIRSPLMAILGFSESIFEEVKDKIPEELEYAFIAIQNSGKRLYRTIELNLNMAQILTNNYKTNFQKISVTETLQPVITDYFKMAKEKNLQFVYEDFSENALIKTDEYSLKLMVQNIIDNAIKYTNVGKIIIKCYLDKNRNVNIDVSDTGIGISKDYLDKLFIPYTQEVMGYNRPFEGSRLGLALSKKIAEIINADIKVKSEKSEGTMFTITFYQNIEKI
jgi:signal transduction histidine kinase